MTMLIRQCLFYSIPLMITYLFMNLGNFLSMMIIASLGTSSLAAGAIISTTFGTMIMIVLSFLIPVSIQSGFFIGKKQLSDVGGIVHKGLIIATTLGLLFIILMLLSRSILSFFHQPVTASTLVSEYFYTAALGFLPFCWSLVLGQLFIGIGNLRTYLIFSLSNMLFTLSLTYLLVKGNFLFSSLGMQGAGYAFSISSWITFVAQLVYIALSKKFSSFNLLKANLIHSWKPMLKMATNIAIQRGNEFVALMIFIYFIGYLLNEEALGAQQIMLQITMLTTLVPFGISQAMGPLVAKYIGKKDFENAYKLGWIANAIGLVLIFVISSIFVLNSTHLINLFANRSQSGLNVKSLAHSIFVLTMIYVAFDTLRLITSGVLRGFNETKNPMLASLISFWIIAFPLVYLAHKLYPSNLVAINCAFLMGIIMNCVFNFIFMLGIKNKFINSTENQVIISEN